MSAGSDNEILIGSGESPDGVAVRYFEVDRPMTVGAYGSTGFIVEARGADGKRITHSDTLRGLIGAGFKLDPAPAAESTSEEVKRGPGRPKKIS